MQYQHEDEPNTELRLKKCMGAYSTRTGRNGFFTTLGELEFQECYDEITTMSIEGLKQDNNYNYKGSIMKLPPALQSLRIKDCNGLKEFPMSLPRTIHTVFLVNTRVHEIPDISHLVNLELLDMYGSSVSRVDRPLPASLRTLTLTHNRLNYIDYDILPTNLARLSVAHNSLQSLPPNRWRNAVVYDNNAGLERQFVDAIMKQKNTTIYNQGQNVHDSTIQASVRSSVDFLFLNSSRDPDFLVKLKRRLDSSSTSNPIVSALYAVGSIFNSKSSKHSFLDSWVDIKTTIGTSSRTLSDLLERAYSIAEKHEDSDVIFERLSQELIDGQDMCFTGRISRIVNAFVGFVEGVEIRVSDRAELHARIDVILRKKSRAKKESGVNTHESGVNTHESGVYKEFLTLISSHCDMPEAEFDAWLEAYEDYEEDY